MDVLRSFDELCAALNAKPCPPGRVRVYRGQTHDYPPRPSGVRKRLDRDAIWRFYSRRLLAEMTGKPLQEELDIAELQTWDLWLPMLAQHYGAGSDYLDVTHSIEIAVWFALNEGKLTSVRSMLGPPGPPSPEDLPSDVAWLAYSPFEKVGSIYAFDVPPWDMLELPRRGDLVDLALGPTEYRSPRVLAQHACLVRADKAVSDGTLSEYLVDGTPLRIGRPWSGPPDAATSVEDVFPAPAVDGWYKRFLSVPMLLTPDPQTGVVALRRPIPVMCMRGVNAKYDREIVTTETYFAPALLHKALRNGPAGQDMISGIAATAPILLEAPMLSSYPPAASALWNQDLLHADMDDEVPVYDVVSNARDGVVSLRDVLFQFSTLEESWWADSAGNHEADRIIRGIRLVRDGESIVAHLVLQDFGSARIGVVGPVEFRFDAGSRRFVWRAQTSMPWKPIGELPLFDKSLFVALHLLRTVSLTLSAQAFPMLVTDGTKAVVPVSAGAARLYRIADPLGAADWYVVRDTNGDPYTDTKEGRVVTIESTASFADISAAAIRAELPAD